MFVSKSLIGFRYLWLSGLLLGLLTPFSARALDNQPLAADVASTVLTGVVSDAETGLPLSGVVVSLAGQNTVTDDQGSYYLEGVPSGTLNANFNGNNTVGSAPLTVDFYDASTDVTQSLTAEVSGYVPYNYEHLRIESSVVNQHHFSMTRILEIDQIRFILSWGENPRDLDSHLVTPDIEGNAYHIAYYSRGSTDYAPYAELDVDDITSYGPETVTIQSLFEGTYHYYVHLYAGTGNLATSSAAVQIYSDQGLEHSLSVPTSGIGRYWYVGTLDGATGQFSAINRIQEAVPGSDANFDALALADYPPKAASLETASESVIAWNWNFGDGTVSQEKNPQHTYSEPGTYTVSLTVTNADGLSSSVVKQDFVHVLQDELHTSLTGIVTDASTGLPLSNVIVSIAGQSALTDDNGFYHVEDVPAGELNADFYANNTEGSAPLSVAFYNASSDAAQSLSAEAAGFVPYNYPVSIVPDIENEHNFSMSHNLTTDQMRFVLSWGENPRDLDSHLLTPDIEGNAYHIAYYSRGNSDSAPYAELDVDDTTSYGPETVTIQRLFEGTYHYYVHLYAGTGDLATSNATVQVYDGSGLLHSLNVPTTGVGRYWYVGTFDGNTGQLNIVNRIQEEQPIASAGSNALASVDYPPKAEISEALNSTIVAFNWDFGDGTESAEENPLHTYSEPGTYTVSLTVTNADGLSSSVVKQDFVHVLQDELHTSLTGIVTDASTGLPLSNVIVSIAGQSALTDDNGFYHVEDVPAGELNADFYANNTEGSAPLSVAFYNASSDAAQSLSAEAAGFVSYNYPVSIVPDIENEHHFSMSHNLTTDQMRFVLSWGENPRDLDSHLLTPDIEGNAYHIAYYSRGNSDSAPYTELDVDDTTSYGPETVTIQRLFEGTYHYYVHLYAGTGDLATSNATVQVYDGSGLLHSLNVPTTGVGRYWYVGTFDGNTGQLNIVNRIQEEQPISSAGSNALASVDYPPKAEISEALNSTIVAFNWDFGDGTESAEENPLHIYTQPGAYTVSLTVTNADAISDTVVKQSYINVTNGESTSLSVTTNGPGSVSSSPVGILCGQRCEATFDPSTRVTLTALANVGATFNGWMGDCANTTGATCTLTMDQARTVEANFSLIDNPDLPLAVSVVGEGQVSSTPAGINCTDLCLGSFPADTELELNATPASGWHFVGWEGGCTGATPTCTLTLEFAEAISAIFEQDAVAGQQPLDVIVVGTGSVVSTPTGIDCGADCSETYSDGTMVTLTATPRGDTQFIGWGGACVDSGLNPICQVSMDQTQLVVAAFGGFIVNRESTAWQVAEIYMATLGYAPDDEGLQYWVTNIDVMPQWNPVTVAQSFFDQPLVQQEYPEEQGYGPFIDALYRNIFGRGADAQGYAYWLSELEQGHVARNQMVIAMINGGWDNPSPDAQSDMLRFSNRLQVALAFAEYQSEQGILYGQLNETDQAYMRQVGSDILLNVTADEATRDTAIASIPTLLNPLR